MNASALPIVKWDASGDALGRWWTREPDGRILCQLCPRACRLKAGDRGFCFVRSHRHDSMVLDTYGHSTGFCIDPIEKKPLNHFLPGTSVLSFGTAGCNLGCKFCQNWDISKSREVARLSEHASPEAIAQAAVAAGARSVAFTYNDPVIWAEYAIDTAAAARARGVQAVAVTAGYITPQARGDFFAAMDATNIDLKAFSEHFYQHVTLSHLQPVLDTIQYVTRETDVWVELTNLIIPDANDDPDQLRRMCDWIVTAAGDEVPLHFSGFHPDYRMQDRPATPHETLIQAYEIARAAGLRYVYVGNVHDVQRQSTYCPGCNELLIQRDWHQLGRYQLDGNRCRHCGHTIAGRFESEPGTWGRRRLPIRIRSEESSQPPAVSTPTLPMRPPKESSPMQTSTDHAAELQFSDDQLSTIQQAACRIVAAVVHRHAIDVAALLGPLAERLVAGVYVTLRRGDTLRGCCGLQGSSQRLDTALAQAARRTATEDPRMAPIAAAELPYLSCGISLLAAPQSITARGDDRVGAVIVGQHGLRIHMAGKVGLLLPSVARDRDWNARQFLDAICTKAGLPAGSWRSDEATVEIFDGVDTSGPMIIDDVAEVDHAVFSAEQLGALRGWVHANLIALRSGATPSYYAAAVDDAAVQGIVLRIEPSPQQPPAAWTQLRIRDSVPLQSTLFQMTQTAAESLSHHDPASNWHVDLAVLSSVIHHGDASDNDLAGVDPLRRAVIAVEGRRWAIGRDRAATVSELLDQTLAAEAFRSPWTQIYTAVCDSTLPAITVSQGVRGDATTSVRPPAVAGTFYPADDQQCQQLVDALLADLPPVQPQSVAAAMVPHAGLRYSGRIAADVWRRIEIPESVLIIGPKHTPDGVDWAVAPHTRWQLSPTAAIDGDLELAQRIADAVPGMQLDSQAHAREHGSEVQLPLLWRLAPHTRIAAIAMARGSNDELIAAADALAECLMAMDQPPLLVISSDMNHFADDPETRRRDALALQQMQRLDPAGLLRVCSDENISMCGQLPAALVLWTLQAMGRRVRYQEIAYGTSADTSGDRSRVVGYAGVLFTP